MKKFSVLKAFAAIIATLTIAWATGCGNDDHATVNPIQPQQTKIAFHSGRATGDVTGEPYIMKRDGSGVTALPYDTMPSMP